MSTQNTTVIDNRENAYWPAAALPTDPTEMADRVEQANQPIEDDSEYATLYFIS